ncbi:hypothetical protein [Thiobacillus sp.]|uniref:hypothetical protein n=1 Tax=Thiobacillus sp. TaxID=924 RepID=UPI00286E94AF|nr:hypothetical protein [Thiobacillus sp.]
MRLSALAAVLLMPALCAAQEGANHVPLQTDTSASGWAFAATGYYYALDDQDNYFSAIATADRDALHLEARYNYEAIDSASLFAGWTFAGGDSVSWEITPIIGAVMGSKHGIAPGLEASAAYGMVDFYIEAEYVGDLDVRDDSFTYAWSELGFTPLTWLRFGLVGQRSRVYESDRDIQRGGFAQLTAGRFTLGAYVFNPDDSADRFAIVSLGASF